MNNMLSQLLDNGVLQLGVFETIYMTFISTFFSYLIGLPLGIFLSITEKGGICALPWLNKLLGFVVNIFRSIPFVILMIAVHETEEIIIGDLTQFQISKKDKVVIGHNAVKKILSPLLDPSQIEEIILEFDERKTKEALFAHYCDKLECDLQSRLYEGSVDLNSQEGNHTKDDKRVQALLETGMSWSEMWLKFGQSNYNYDENFTAVSNEAINSNYRENISQELESEKSEIKKYLKQLQM